MLSLLIFAATQPQQINWDASKEIFLDIKKLVVFGFINSQTFGNSNICVKGDSPEILHVGMQSLMWNFLYQWGWQFWGYSTVLWPLNPWKDGNSSNSQKQMKTLGFFKLIFPKIGLTELKGQFKVQRITPWIEMWKVQAANVQWPLIVCSQRSDASNLEFQFFIKTALSLSPFLATIVHCLASYCQNELWPWL